MPAGPEQAREHRSRDPPVAVGTAPEWRIGARPGMPAARADTQGTPTLSRGQTRQPGRRRTTACPENTTARRVREAGVTAAERATVPGRASGTAPVRACTAVPVAGTGKRARAPVPGKEAPERAERAPAPVRVREEAADARAEEAQVSSPPASTAGRTGWVAGERTPRTPKPPPKRDQRRTSAAPGRGPWDRASSLLSLIACVCSSLAYVLRGPAARPARRTGSERKLREAYVPLRRRRSGASV